MKVAVATDDGTRLSMHFGRSAGFIVFNVDGQIITNEGIRDNRHTLHALGQCAGHEDGHAAGHGHAGHSHGGLISLLEGCEAVLCGGMGNAAAEELLANHIRPVIVRSAASPEELVGQFVRGELQPAAGFCGCS